MPGPAVPGIGTVPAVPASLPGLPSPATGVPSTPDLLTNLISNSQSLTQGYEQGMQIKEQRRKQAMDDLQVLSQQAASNPTDPAIIRSLSKTAKKLGYDPNVFLSQDGKSVNTGALAQYNPYFQTAMQVLANPNADPAVQTYFANLIGLKDFKATGVSMKVLEDDQRAYQDARDKFTGGTGDPAAVKSAGQKYAQDLMQRGDTVSSQNIMNEIGSLHVGMKPQAQVEGIGAAISMDLQKADLFKQQAKLAVVNQLKAEAQVGLIKQQTVEAAHRVGLIDAQTYASYQHVRIAEQNAQTAQQRVQVALQNASTKNLDVAERAIKDYNGSVNALQTHLNGLTSQMTQLQNNDNWFKQDGVTLTPQAQVIQTQITQLQKLQKQMPMIDPKAAVNAATHNAGLPNTTTVLPSAPPAAGGGQTQDLRGQTYTVDELRTMARKNHKPVDAKSLKTYIEQIKQRGAQVIGTP